VDFYLWSLNGLVVINSDYRNPDPADIGRATSLARRLEHGSVWINGWWMGGVQAPTGGMKESGIGRERGLAGVRNYLQI